MMKHLRAVAVILMVLWGTANPLATEAQLGYTPPANAAYVFSAGAWNALTATGTAGQIAYTPPAIGLYGFNGTGWVPCGTNACGSGGGGTGTVNTGATNDLAYYPASGTTVGPAHSSGAVTPQIVSTSGAAQLQIIGGNLASTLYSNGNPAWITGMYTGFCLNANDYCVISQTANAALLNISTTAVTALGVPVIAPQFKGTGTAPTCSVAAGAGTGASCSILASSTNTSGQLTLVTGTTPAAGLQVTINWNGTLASAPGNCPINPRTSATASLGNDIYDGAPSTTGLQIGTGGTAFLGSTTFVLGYGPCV